MFSVAENLQLGAVAVSTAWAGCLPAPPNHTLPSTKQRSSGVNMKSEYLLTLVRNCIQFVQILTGSL
jgi:hypothetical protein